MKKKKIYLYGYKNGKIIWHGPAAQSGHKPSS